MGWWLLLAVFLFLLCAVLLVAEIFVPSGGIISVLAITSLIAGLVICFKHSMATGVLGIVVAIIMIPATLVMAYRALPGTRFGKAVMLSPPERNSGDAIPDTVQLSEMLGKTGKVLTPLRPVGMVEFEDNRLECVAESGFVSKGETVKVIKIEGTQLTVRIIEI